MSTARPVKCTRAGRRGGGGAAGVGGDARARVRLAARAARRRLVVRIFDFV